MVAYSFRPMFIPLILSGAKRQTIRAIGRRRHAIPGETLQLYTGMRTKHCLLIGTAICTAAEPITMWFAGEQSVEIGSRRYIAGAGLRKFAIADGFADWPAMLAFWRETHPECADSFSGVIIEWGGFTPAALVRRG